jgi:P27 family predicted phage terminase small subunit
MAGKRQATAVVIANGKSHMTKAEIQERLDAEDAARGQDESTQFHAPSWLPQALRSEFNDLRAQLVDRGLIAKIDRDILGFYLVARVEYVNAGQRASMAISKGDAEGAKDWSAIQERYFKQAKGCANDLGLTITSRCRLVLPPKEEEAPDEFTAFLQRRQAAGDQ